MSTVRMKDQVTLVLLRVGMAIPFIYYGIQIIAAAFYPRYSFVSNVASELGSDLAEYPVPFNVALMILGVLTLLASMGFLRALLQSGARPILAWLTGLALAVNGVQTLWAGYFPMPDPRHGGHPLFILAMILLPFLIAAALWRQSGTGLKTYLLATIALLVAMIPIMSGMTGLDTQSYKGVFQRLFTLTVFPPIGVGAYFLAKRIEALETGELKQP